jgi:TatA/E family protein of Tat protein translocase
MPQVGPLEIFVVALVALIVFGPEKLPEIARTLGRTLSDFRRTVDEAKEEFHSGLNFGDEDPDHPMNEALFGSPEPVQASSRYEQLPAHDNEDNPHEGPETEAPTASPTLKPIPTRIDPPIPTRIDPAPPREEPNDA